MASSTCLAENEIELPVWLLSRRRVFLNLLSEFRMVGLNWRLNSLEQTEDFSERVPSSKVMGWLVGALGAPFRLFTVVHSFFTPDRKSQVSRCLIDFDLRC